MSEVRLIDANALMERLERKKCEPAKIRYTEGFNDALMRFRSMVHAAPTIDAVPVVHGEWIKNENGTWTCNHCQSWIPNEQHYYARFCLHCGAMMDSPCADCQEFDCYGCEYKKGT